MDPNYETFGSCGHGKQRLDSETSTASSSSPREVNGFRATTRTWDTPFGKIRLCSDLETIERVFLFVATVSIVGTTAMTLYRLFNSIDDSDSTFASVLLVNIVFCLVYVYHGVFGERPYELWAFMAATIVIIFYSIIQFAVKSDRTTLLLVRLIVVLVFGAINLFLSYKISVQHYTSNNLIIRTLRSANIRFQNMCVSMFVFQTLLKFDLETGMSLVVLVLTSGFEEATTQEIVILVAGLFLEIVWFIVGYVVPRYEDMSWVYAFLLLSIPQPAYVIFKIVKTGVDWNKQSGTISGSIIACACLFLVTRLMVLYYLWIVVKNFGKGLRKAVYLPADDEHNGNVEVGVDGGTPSPEANRDEDYLGEAVNYDVH